ncbi:MAG: DEDD exonuclease domain-containing protein [Candidatus Kapaibacteriales bacterium]
MYSFWDKTFAVVDLETTGSDPIKNRITEISCVFIKGGEIVSDLTSLINPHQFIPPFIAKMTGISNEMAAQAPEENTVLPKFAEELSKPDVVFVAHNLEFDWSFLYETMLRNKINVPAMTRLCSLKLARRLLPKHLKKNVGSLAELFNIPMRRAHRAYDDAVATARIFIELLNIAEREHGMYTIGELASLQSKNTKHHNAKNPDLAEVKKQVLALPDSPGVYYFKDSHGEVIYIGKAKNLRRRVMSYFTASAISSSKILAIISRISKLEHKKVPTELDALILESTEIKRLQPSYNKANKRYRTFPFIKLTSDPYPRYEVCQNIGTDNAEYFGPFRNGSLVDEISKIIDRNFKLRKCEEALKPTDTIEPCIFYRMKRCDAPCADLQTEQEYSLEVDKVRSFLTGFRDGIIDHLEESMHLYSEKMEYEKAGEMKQQIDELKRLFARQKKVPTSIQKNNLILLLPADKKSQRTEIYLVKSGKLVNSSVANGSELPISTLAEVKHWFYNGSPEFSQYTKEDIDQVRIITSWIYNNQERAEFIYLEGKEYDEVTADLTKSLQNINYDHVGSTEEVI